MSDNVVHITHQWPHTHTHMHTHTHTHTHAHTHTQTHTHTHTLTDYIIALDQEIHGKMDMWTAYLLCTVLKFLIHHHKKIYTNVLTC